MSALFYLMPLISMPSNPHLKSILITGGSSDIGLSTAQLLSSQNPNNNIVLLDLQRPPSSFKHDPAHLLVHTSDITRWAEQRASFEMAYERFRRIDCVFVNAGISEHGEQSFTDGMDRERKLKEPERRVLGIDLDTACDTTKLAVTYLRKNAEGGQIVLTVSPAGYLASAGAELYSAAKHGMPLSPLCCMPSLGSGDYVQRHRRLDARFQARMPET